MALKCFSSVSTARPTHSKIRRACARCVGVARGPRQIAVMPSPTTHGVLGMARTIGLSVPSIVEICVESTPAAIETTSASAQPGGGERGEGDGACAGLTHSTTTPAERAVLTSGSTGRRGRRRPRGRCRPIARCPTRAPARARRPRAGLQDRAPHHAHADDAEGVAVGEQRRPAGRGVHAADLARRVQVAASRVSNGMREARDAPPRVGVAEGPAPSSSPSTAAGRAGPSARWPGAGQIGHVSPAASSHIVNTKSRAANRRPNSSQLLLRSPAVGSPASRRISSAKG